MVAVAVHLKWHQTFLFLFQTVLFVADTITDVLTSLEYEKQGQRHWFGVSIGLTVISMVVHALTLHVYRKTKESTQTKRNFKFLNRFNSICN